MSFPPQHSGYPAPGPQGFYGSPPPAKPRRGFAEFTAPLIIAVLGVVGILLGFAPVRTEESAYGYYDVATWSWFETNSITVAFLLIAGVIAAIGLLPNQPNLLSISAAASLSAVVTTVVMMVRMSDDELTLGWGMGMVLLVALAQTAVAVIAVLADAGVVGSRRQAAQWVAPQPFPGQPFPGQPFPGQPYQPQQPSNPFEPRQ